MKKAILFCLLGTALNSSAQADPFAELELDAKKTAAVPEPGILHQLFSNLSGAVQLNSSHFMKDPKTPVPFLPDPESRNNFWSATVDFKSFARNNNFTLGFSGWLQSGNHDNTFQGSSLTGGNFLQDDEVRKQRYFSLNEIYMVFKKDRFDITLGKKQLRNGTAVLFSQANNLMPVIGFDPLHTRRGGIWQGRLDYHQNNTTYTLAVLPVYAPSKMPPPTSRWYANAASAAASYVPSDIPEPAWNNIGWFGRIKTVQSGWDLYASCYAGPGRNYLLKYDRITLNPQKMLQRTTPDVVTPAMGYSTAFGAWEFHGETTYTHSMHNADQDYITFTQGVTRNLDGGLAHQLGFEQIFTTVEYSWEWVTGEQRPGLLSGASRGYVTDSADARFGKQDLLSLINFKWNEKLNLDYALAMRFDSWGYLNHVACNWNCRKNATLSAGIQAFGGSQNDNLSPDGMTLNYGNWTQNNRAFLSLRYTF